MSSSFVVVAVVVYFKAAKTTKNSSGVPQKQKKMRCNLPAASRVRIHISMTSRTNNAGTVVSIIELPLSSEILVYENA